MPQQIKIMLLITLLFIVFISVYTTIRFRTLRRDLLRDPDNKKSRKLLKLYMILMFLMMLILAVITLYIFMKLK